MFDLLVMCYMCLCKGEGESWCGEKTVCLSSLVAVTTVNVGDRFLNTHITGNEAVQLDSHISCLYEAVHFTPQAICN